MKKSLLSLLLSLSFATTAFAQDDEETKTSSAPAAKSAGNGGEFLGISLDLTTMQEWNVVFKINPKFAVTAIFGFDYWDDEDDNDGTDILIGAGVAFTFYEALLPLAAEADLKLAFGDNDDEKGVRVDMLLDVTAPVLPHFNLTAKAGLQVIKHTEGREEFYLGPVTKINATWFFL